MKQKQDTMKKEKKNQEKEQNFRNYNLIVKISHKLRKFFQKVTKRKRNRRKEN